MYQFNISSIRPYKFISLSLRIYSYIQAYKHIVIDIRVDRVFSVCIQTDSKEKKHASIKLSPSTHHTPYSLMSTIGCVCAVSIYQM